MAFGALAFQGLFSSSSSSPSRVLDAGGAGSIRAARLALAALLLAAAAAAGAAPYAPRDFDFGDAASVDAAVCGVVETVREVQLQAAPAALADVFEHAVNTRTADELRVRLDDGRLVVVVLDGARRFRPGARVRLLHGQIFPT